jgi:general secretion pathway protein D
MQKRSTTSLALIFCFLFTPALAFGKRGEKNFKQGIKYEKAQQWDRAAQEFTFAVAADPSNVEYQLHYRRTLFNASQSCMRLGRDLEEQRDYVGAFNAFRQAYGYDAVNQLAVSEMRRMVLLQEDSKGGGLTSTTDRDETAKDFKRIRYTANTESESGRAAKDNSNGPRQPRAQQLRVISYDGDLEALISSLATQLDVNVVFDTQSFRQPRTIRINLRDVSTSKALDLIFLKEGLFFQKVDRRTIIVADQARRPQFQQLVLRTFYLANIDPQDAQKLIQAAIPASVGRPQAIVATEKSTNSLTVRDTAENVRLIGELLKNIDKERAEVVMDVQIYEVSAADLLQIGNQLGTDSTLANLGGTSSLSTIVGSREVAQQVFSAPTALGAALVLPSSTLSLLQKNDRSRVLASTQIHAFDGEKSDIHIGERVPVQTATVYPTSTTSANSNGYPVINYEPTGLTLEFTPQVYPNLDVQVKMSIKSNDVANASTLTPTFTERTLSGTARIQNNQTMMIASVSQNQQSQGRVGLPVVGLIPVLGRLFTAPSKDGKQTDIVVAVTPRVLRAPAITPRDEEMRLSGTLQAPTTEPLEALIAEADRQEQMAAARSTPKDARVQVSDQETTTFVPAPKALANQVIPILPQPSDASGQAALLNHTVSTERAQSSMSNALNSLTGSQPQTLAMTGVTGETVSTTQTVSGFELSSVAERATMNIGEKTTLKIMIKTDEPVSLAVLKLGFDPRRVVVQKALAGEVFANEVPQIRQSTDKNGELLLAISGVTIHGSGVLLTLTIEALTKGENAIVFISDAVHLIGTDGREIRARQLGRARIVVQ